MNKEEMNEREDLILNFKKLLCEYTFFHKKMQPQDIYSRVENTTKCLSKLKMLMEQLKEKKKDKNVECIDNITATGEIRVLLEEKDYRIYFDVQPDGEVVATKSFKEIKKLKEDKDVQEYINIVWAS